MITREEFAIMQQQMVDMNNEKLNMKAQIDSLQQSITQIDIIKKMINDSKLSIEKENASFKEEESKIMSKINDQKKNMNEPSLLKAWDAKKLARLENTIQELNSTITNQNSTILDLENQIKEYQIKRREMNENIKRIEIEINHNANIMKRIESFGAIRIKISELESRLYAIQHVRKKNLKRISNNTLSKTNIGKSNDVKQSKLDDLIHKLSTIATSINSIEPDSEQSQSELTILQNEENSLNAEIDQLLNEEKKRELEFSEVFQKEKDEKDAIQNTLNKITEQSTQLKQSIDQSSTGNSILINKKISLIKQLKQSIKGKIKDITQSRSSSPHVLQLVDQQEKQWVEKQQLLEIYNKVEAKHKKLTTIVARKGIIAVELKDFMKTVPPLDQKFASNPLAVLDNAYQAALEENRARAANISDISQLLNEIEKENKELKRAI